MLIVSGSLTLIKFYGTHSAYSCPSQFIFSGTFTVSTSHACLPALRLHIDDILLWDSSAADVGQRVEMVLRLLHAARFRIKVKKSQLISRGTIQYCGLAFSAGKMWNFTLDKITTLKEVLRTWENTKKARTQRYLGFPVYVLNASGLSSAWARLIQHYQPWRCLFQCIFDRFPRTWKDKHPRHTNWSCDAGSGDLAVVDEKRILQWHAVHTQHINVAEVMALCKAMILAPQRAAIWTDSRVAAAWTRKPKCWQFSAMLSWLLVSKQLQVNWLPSAWNPADAYTRLTPPFRRRIERCNRKQLGRLFTPRECLREVLPCGELSARYEWRHEIWLDEYD